MVLLSFGTVNDDEAELESAFFLALMGRVEALGAGSLAGEKEVMDEAGLRDGLADVVALPVDLVVFCLAGRVEGFAVAFGGFGEEGGARVF